MNLLKPNLLKPKKDPKKERLEFVKYWANYVKTHPDKIWSKQQKILIDSQLSSTKQLQRKSKKVFNLLREIFKY